jgi:hypothetical protein
MATCESTSFIYPLLVDIYYPIVEQSPYGNVKKEWILDKTVASNFNAVGSAGKEEIKPNVNITKDSLLIGRVKTDIRMSSVGSKNSTTNIILTNIKDKHGNSIYNELSGPRVGKATIFEIATIEPFLGPFGSVEYYSLVIRRSENQGVDV